MSKKEKNKQWAAIDPRDGKWKDAVTASWPPYRNKDREHCVTITFSDGYQAETPLEFTNFDG